MATPTTPLASIITLAATKQAEGVLTTVSSFASLAATSAGATSTALPTSTPLPPLAVITDTDQRGLLILIAALLLSFVFATFGTRVYTRLRLNGPWQSDDNVLTLATLACIAQAVLIWIQTVSGLGETESFIDDSENATIAKLDVASSIMFLVILWLSKVSHCLFFLRLTPIQDDAKLAWSAIAASTAWVVISILVVNVSCVMTSPWLYLDGGECTSLLSRWWAVASLDVALEVLLFAIAIYMFARVQTTIRYKLSIISVFACRLPLIPVAILRPYYLSKALDISDLTLTASGFVVLSVIESNYAVISNTIPSLFPFITPFSRHWQGSTIGGGSGRNRYANVGRRNKVVRGGDQQDNSKAASDRKASNVLNSNHGSQFTTSSGGQRRLRFGFAGERRYNPEEDKESGMLRKDVISHQAVVSHKNSSRSTMGQEPDTAASSSSGSKPHDSPVEEVEMGEIPSMGIRKDMQWEVTSSDRGVSKA